MQIDVDDVSQANVSAFYISTLDAEDPSTDGRATFTTERNALERSGMLTCPSTALVRTKTPRSMWQAFEKIGQRAEPVSFVTLSGHADKIDHLIHFSSKRFNEGRPPQESDGGAGFAGLIRNIEVLFISTCFAGRHLKTVRDHIPSNNGRKPVLIGFDGILAAGKSVWAAVAIQATIAEGYDFSEQPDQLQLPGEGFCMLLPSESQPFNVKSLTARNAINYQSATYEHIASLSRSN